MNISVRITRKENAEYYGAAAGDSVRIPLECYVAGVVASEVGNSALEVCKAQAVAARTFAVCKGVLDGKAITDSSSSDQAFRAGRIPSGLYPNAEQGAEDTAGEILVYNGQPISAVYSASNGGRTVSSAERWGSARPYLIVRDDPFDDSEKRTGHGVGMSQRGAKAMAKAGKSYEEILGFYYPGTNIEPIREGGGDRMIAAKDFILQVLIPLREAWGYIYGYAGTMWTAALQEQIERTTDANRQASRQYGSQWIGRMVTDCSGLLRRAIRKLGGDIPHQARYQYTDHCRAKGKLVNGQREDGKPILPGTAVFLQAPQERIHHVGVYVGSGICVEAKGARYGVVTSKLDHWDHWGELKIIDYTDAAALEGAIEIPERGEGRAEEPKRMAVVDNPSTWLNVRSGPKEDASRLFRLEKGTAVEILSRDGDWAQIRAGGRIGWAWAAYLRIEEEEEEPGDGEEEIDLSGTEKEPSPEAETSSEAVPADDPGAAVIAELRGIRENIDRVIRMLGGEAL